MIVKRSNLNSQRSNWVMEKKWKKNAVLELETKCQVVIEIYVWVQKKFPGSFGLCCSNYLFNMPFIWMHRLLYVWNVTTIELGWLLDVSQIRIFWDELGNKQNQIPWHKLKLVSRAPHITNKSIRLVKRVYLKPLINNNF